MANPRIAALVAATLIAIGTPTTIWLKGTPESAPVLKPSLALYQAKCHTLYVNAFAILSKEGIYFKAGEALRTAEQAKLNAAKGVGIAESLHRQSLAWDLFRVMPDGTVSMDLKDYEAAGRVWTLLGEKLGIVTHWGGDFKHTKDGVHFSCGYRGFK